MRTTLFTCFALVLFLGCNSPTSKPNQAADGVSVFTPLLAIEAAASKPMGVQGTFELEVKRSEYGQDRSKEFVFLNSEEDYRDRRCLTVRIIPSAVRDFLSKGVDPTKFYRGKKIRVEGVAEQTKIYFYSDSGIQTNKYYYQTHIQVRSQDQISVIPG